MVNSLSMKVKKLISSEQTKLALGEHFPILDEITKNDVFSLKFKRMEDEGSFSLKMLRETFYPLLADYGYHSSEAFGKDLYDYALSLIFPEKFTYPKENEALYQLFMQLLRILYHREAQKNTDSNYHQYQVALLSEDYFKKFEAAEEYASFIQSYYNAFVYEAMRLGMELFGFNTLEHVIMIHHLAVSIGQQMNEREFEVDMCKISAASLGHDIGKFGCTGEEVTRVPYLHYYYTDVWFKANQMPSIGHIAQNHSVWDLELENLPIESLILIYCDFRVKNNEKGQMTIFSLKDSFEVILHKLDNVDEAKVKRYQRAYEKLKDFENYLLTAGIDVQDETIGSSASLAKPYAILFDREITDSLKFYAISNNIHIMYLLRSEASLTSLLEFARTERSSINIRDYIGVFKEYSTHLSQKQKSLMMKFLFETIINPEEDIRIEAAKLMGILVSNYDEDYRKEIPKNASMNKSDMDSVELFDFYAHKMLDYTAKLIPLHKKWLGLSFSYFAIAFSQHERMDERKLLRFREVIDRLIEDSLSDKSSLMYLLFGLFQMKTNDELIVDRIIQTALTQIEAPEYNLRCTCLTVLWKYTAQIRQEDRSYRLLLNYLEKYSLLPSPVSINYIHQKLSEALERTDLSEIFRQCIIDSDEKISDIFLSDLKTATSAMQKMIHIEILTEHALQDISLSGAYTTMHFCNILKVSEMELVRSKAGKSIIKLFPHLSIEQKNDIAVELLRSLEIQDYKFAKFIPEYFGDLLLFLPPKELDEIIDDFEVKIKTSDSGINLLILNTIGRSVSLYEKYREIYPFDQGNQRRLFKMIGLIISCLSHYNEKINTEALAVLSEHIFSSRHISAHLKAEIFQKTAKKILTQLPTRSVSFRQLSIGSSMNGIYRYISDYELENGPMTYEHKDQIAFFPGTFDPFTLSHKNIARTIRDLGMEVYLAVDEFSWSKRTQPHMVRRNIVRMAMADEFDIYIYPSSMPVNLTNDQDIQKLQDNFAGKKLYIATGKDVLLNASAYQKNTKIRQIPHIIFDRPEDRPASLHAAAQPPSEKSERFDEYVKEHIVLNLDDEYQNISSTLIRDCIDSGKDISNLIDPLAEKFILKEGLYKKEPLFKTDVENFQKKIEIIRHPDQKLLKNIKAEFPQINWEQLKAFGSDENVRVMRLIDTKNQTVLGYSVFKWMPTTSIYSNFQDKDICDIIRSVYVGRMAHLGGIFGDERTMFLLLTETLTYALEKDYTFMVTSNQIAKDSGALFEKLLRQNGFAPISEKKSVYYVNMSNPCTLLMNLENYIKAPFIHQENIREVIMQTRIRLQKAICNLYPSHLLISFDNAMFNKKLIEKICVENKVPDLPLVPRRLGNKMCVPFGNVLSKFTVPNTVTKSLHTEKTFERDMNGFSIRSYPYYLPLDRQIKTIRSFDRQVILVDDILNKGYRIKALDPMLHKQDIRVSKVIVGILTSRGKELMDIQQREVDYAYFIPKMNVWFNEGLLYPFISGDGIQGTELLGASIPSINLILPYTSPHFIKDTSKEAIYEFSLTCLENAKRILEALEKEYEHLFERKLTISALNEVMVFPRVVDYGDHLKYTANTCPSAYVSEDIEKLERLKKMILR